MVDGQEEKLGTKEKVVREEGGECRKRVFMEVKRGDIFREDSSREC